MPGFLFYFVNCPEKKQKAGEKAGLLSGDSGSRTHDLQIANLSLYQLSYIPIG